VFPAGAGDGVWLVLNHGYWLVASTTTNLKLQGVQEFCASILYLVVLCQFLISDTRQDSFEKPRARSRSQRGRFLDKGQK
jgi:hypothetical protein